MLDKNLTFGGVFFMSKYSSELKLQIVKYCVEEYHSSYDAAKKFNLPDPTPIKRWIRRYQEHGVEGLIKQQESSYSGFFKENVIKYMHNNHLSATEVAIHFRIEVTAVLKWERIYYEEGPQTLYEERRGRRKNMNSKPEKKKLSKEVENDLIAENQRLRMENEYLKKLNALVQERINRENKKK